MKLEEVGVKAAGSFESTDGLYFLPNFNGISFPYYRDDAQASLWGLKLEHTHYVIRQFPVNSSAAWAS
jgi:glycerol kinase